MSEAEPEEFANQVSFHREARWLRSSTRGLVNGLHGIARSKGRGSLASQIAGSSFPLHVRPDRSRSTAASPARQRSAAKRHQSSARSYRPAPDRWASLPIHPHSALSLSSTALARGLSGGLGRDQMQPERTQHSRKALRGRPQAAIPGGSASGAPPLGGAPLPAAANAEAFFPLALRPESMP